MIVVFRQLLASILTLIIAIPANAVSFDPVGNRTQKTSTIPGYPGGLTNCNANDQISTNTYDSDGNTTASNGVGYVYDFENHLVQAGGGISIVYDGDGNRVSKTVAGVTTQYLVDDRNPTGYAQVVYEAFSGGTAPNRESSHNFYYGLELVTELRTNLVNGSQAHSLISFDYDGHGSVRALTDQNGNVTDTYDYDAFGNLIHSTGSTPNNYLFAGEQFDSDLNLYYNRARYLNVSTGRFWTMDTYQGYAESPLSLHKYLYVAGSPVDRVDPSGNFGLEEAMAAIAIGLVIYAMSGCSSSKQVTLPVTVTNLTGFQTDDYGAYLDLGAKTKSRSPSYPEYNWVQWVTTNAIEANLKKYLKPGVPYLDPPRVPGSPPYYYIGNEPRDNFPGYDLGFHDHAHRDPGQFPETGGVIDWDARLLLVGVNPAGSNSYTPIIQISWGFTVDKSGNTYSKSVLITQCRTGGCMP